jgi:hypothetical protein
MKKIGTSVSFKPATIGVLHRLIEATKPTPSLSQMVEHLVETNPAYIAQGKIDPPKIKTKKNKK